MIANVTSESSHIADFCNIYICVHSSLKPTLTFDTETGFIRFGHLQVPLCDRNPVNNDYSIRLYRCVRHHRPIYCGIPISTFNCFKFVDSAFDKSFAVAKENPSTDCQISNSRQQFLKSESHIVIILS